MVGTYRAVAAAGGDPSFSSVTTLFHFNGANLSTTFTDSSTNAYSFSKTAFSGITGTTGNISTIDPKFGTGSFRNTGTTQNASGIYFDSRTLSGGSWIPSNFQMATDFTVEAFIKLPTVATGTALAAWFGLGATRFNAIFFGLATTSPKLTVEYNPTSANYGSGYKALDYSFNTNKVNVWTHFALVRSGNALTLYVDGTAVQPSGSECRFPAARKNSASPVSRRSFSTVPGWCWPYRSRRANRCCASDACDCNRAFDSDDVNSYRY